MVGRITIENYALIEKSTVDFPEGFTVITGETGSGKSIMLDALSLLKGARADSKAMGDKTKKTIVEALFLNPDSRTRETAVINELEWDDKELIIRREILPSGKSRGFVNDTPVNLSVLAQISDSLIDIHSQHSNVLLNDNRMQIELLDSFASDEKIKKEYQGAFTEYVELRKRIKEIKDTEKKHSENREFIEFRLDQLDKLKPKKGELERLEKEFELLSDADRIKSELGEAFLHLDGDSHSALRRLSEANSILENLDLSLFVKEEEEESLFSRLTQVKVELRDISDTLGYYLDRIESNPEKLEKVRNRIENIESAIKRFKVKDDGELVSLHATLKKEIEDLNESRNDLPELEKELKKKAKILKEKADALTESRVANAIGFSSKIEERIRPLGLPNVKFQVEVKGGKMTPEGQDKVEFYCSFNKNHPLQPVSEIASGGEISRVMLGIKSLMAETMDLPTIIFDEIDSGVSGEIAHKMGQMMRDMGSKMQVIAISHLPQVAVNAKSHLKVYKSDDSEKTISQIKSLSDEERVNEIAGMLSGDKINEAALKNAQVLLEIGNK